jgi:hypothetical protein
VFCESDGVFVEKALARDAMLVKGNCKQFPKVPWIMNLAEFIGDGVRPQGWWMLQ